MFVKLAVLACSWAVAAAVWNGPLAGGVPASQFPAGVSPQACPNYPNCNNPALAANPAAPAPQQWNNPAPQWNNPAPQWNNPAPQWNAPAVPQNSGLQSALDQGQYTGDGDWRGEGLAESGAYGNAGQGAWNNPSWNQQAAPAWNNPAPAWNGGHAAGVPAQIPAGVDASSCPNYPFCHA